MPYNPGVTAHGGEFIMQGAMEASRAMGSAIADRLAQAQQNKDANEYYTAAGDALASHTGPDGKPLMDAETLAKYHSAGVNAKKAIYADTLMRYHQGLEDQQRGDKWGMFGAEQALHYSQLSQQGKQHADTLGMEQQRLGQSLEEMNRRYPKGFTPAPPTPLGPEGHPSHLLQQVSPTGYEVVPLPKDATAATPDPQTAINGTVFWNGKTWQQFKAPPGAGAGTGGIPDPRVLAIQNLDTQRATLIQEMGKGGKSLTDKSGAFGWFGDTYQKKFQGLDTERQRLLGDLQTNPPVSAPAAQRTPVSVNPSVQTNGTPAPGTAPTATSAPAGGGLPRVASKADRDALPPGTQYIGPDGQTYTRK